MYALSLVQDMSLKMKYRKSDQDDYIEKLASRIRSNKKTERAAVIFLGSVMHVHEVLAAPGGGFAGIDSLGFKLLGICRSLGYWVCLIMCVNEIIKTAMAGGEVKDIAKIIAKYLLVFGSLYLVPILFDEIPGAFNQR